MLDNFEYPKLKSSAKEMEAFKDTIIWKDLLQVLKERKEILENVLSIETDINEILRAQGGKAEIMELINLPDHLIMSIKQEKEEEDAKKQQKRAG